MGNGDFFKLQRLLPSGILSFLNLCKTRSYTKTAKELHTSVVRFEKYRGIGK